MRKELKKLIDKQFLPQWIVLITDFTIASVTFLFTYLLRFNIFYEPANVSMMTIQLFAGLPFFILSVLLFKPYRGIIRHTTMYDAMVIVEAHLLFSAGYGIISYFGYLFNENLIIPWSVIIIHYFLSVFLMIFFRFCIQNIYRKLLAKPNDTVNIMIFGSGVMGSIARSIIEKDTNIHYNIIGYIDDNRGLWNRQIGGIKIFSPGKAFGEIIKTHSVHEVVLAISVAKIELERKRQIIEKCLADHLKIKEVLDPSSILHGGIKNAKIRNVRIEDLLGREPISIKVDSVNSYIAGKRVMITGGAGSIGSEIVRQLIYLHPESIIIVDQAESAIFEIKNEIQPLINQVEFHALVTDVTDAGKMRRIFSNYRPQIIFHAAAYKHVPIMESQPFEAISNNVGGTKNLADLSIEFGVDKFVMISTDKAVNPTNIMGASKRLCEIYIQSIAQHTPMKTQFITTRFGNVLGSNGSVVPIFEKQITNGGPVTVTHREITRYFMTIPEKHAN